MWEQFYGPLAKGVQLDHVCHNSDRACQGGSTCPHRSCVNLAHLRKASCQENLLASRLTVTRKNADKTHCKSGHEFTEANTYIRKDNGSRMCRKCEALWQANARASDPIFAENHRANSRAYYAANRERLKAAARERWHRDHP
jgi:hypothetical protein